jgi:3-oxoadipate enol-lactonase
MRVEEAGSGPVVLAIHGLGGGAYFFRGLAERLQPDYRVVSVDLPVHGPDYSMQSWVADLGTLVTERAFGHVVILGHSMGTILALEAWKTWPDRIRAMIFVGGLPQVAPHIRARLSERVQLLQNVSNLEGWGRRVSPGVFSPSTFLDRPEVVGAFERLFEGQRVESYVRCCGILLGANAEDAVETVTVPCLAITGTDDQYARPDAVAEFARRLPSPRVEVIPECGHLPFLEQPDKFAATVMSFLRTCYAADFGHGTTGNTD